jgi:hypothetical protein
VAPSSPLRSSPLPPSLVELPQLSPPSTRRKNVWLMFKTCFTSLMSAPLTSSSLQSSLVMQC